ncbi:mechanosensitive ion channel domain-containing protein [Halobacteriovorax sp. HLS]|uniref:mechanosensitive ion channel domain-containing protein n=1 Tax=Halobacteriovorax sp. HLS TaxID=2234000 RepID=UPI000FD7BE82|nr:mechanosensitive ion channel domain-containing protein [Halobacteriovorax sp. HLS]
MEVYLARLIHIFESYPYFRTALLSFILFLFFGLIRKIILNSINKGKAVKQDKILLKRKVSQYLFYFLVVCVFSLWFAQLQVFFVSILAVAAAVVLALKELIMCFTGGSLINISKLFKVGHRIEIDNFRGFVIEKSLLTTKILEIGPEKNSQQTTGDIISIPNSLMLSKALKNESYFKGYSIKSFTYKISDESKLEEFERELLKVSEEFCVGYLAESKDSISKFCDKEGILVPSINPRTKVIVENGKDFSVLVKLPVKSTEIADVEQKLNRFYLEWRILNKDKESKVVAEK